MRQVIFPALLAVTLSLPMFAAGVDPALLALVPPDAKTLAGIQVAQAQSTPIGQALVAQLQLDANANSAMAAAGFDPHRDLREILASFGAGTAGGNTQAVLIGRGSFHPDKIAAAAVSVGAALSTYRGIQLIEAKPSGQGRGPSPAGASSSGTIAFLDASTMLAGDPTSVRAAIDRHAARAVFSGPLADGARLMGGSNDAWIITFTPTSGAPPAAALGSQVGGPLGNILQAALQFSAGLKFTAAQVTLSADVLTRSPQDAQSLVDVLKFAVQMLQAQTNRPQGNASPGPTLADAAQISTAGSTMHVVVSVPEQQLEQFFLPRTAAPAKHVAAR
jgi:hypothetical protein